MLYVEREKKNFVEKNDVNNIYYNNTIPYQQILKKANCYETKNFSQPNCFNNGCNNNCNIQLESRMLIDSKGEPGLTGPQGV